MRSVAIVCCRRADSAAIRPVNGREWNAISSSVAYRTATIDQRAASGCYGAAFVSWLAEDAARSRPAFKLLGKLQPWVPPYLRAIEGSHRL
jgi:hypothetical protein